MQTRESAGVQNVHVGTAALECVSKKNDSAMIHFVTAGQSLHRTALRSPRANTRFEHAVAVMTLLLLFGYELPEQGIFILPKSLSSFQKPDYSSGCHKHHHL